MLDTLYPSINHYLSPAFGLVRPSPDYLAGAFFRMQSFRRLIN